MRRAIFRCARTAQPTLGMYRFVRTARRLPQQQLHLRMTSLRRRLVRIALPQRRLYRRATCPQRQPQRVPHRDQHRTVGVALVPEPHLVEKAKMLAAGTLTRPIDIFDVFWHMLFPTLLVIKLMRAKNAPPESDQ